jgi:hypothetical protein
MADDSGYAGLSETARGYVGGLLAHAPALLAFAAPTTNSYRRLVPGYEAPVNLVYSQRNRSACIRIPVYSSSPKSKRIEFRCPDPTANPYLAFAAMLLAGIDGITLYGTPTVAVPLVFDLPSRTFAIHGDGGLFLGTFSSGEAGEDVDDDWLGAPMFFASLGGDAYGPLLREAGLDVLRDEVVVQNEPGHGDVSFRWVLARAAA